jgi:hypothetical protein
MLKTKLLLSVVAVVLAAAVTPTVLGSNVMVLQVGAGDYRFVEKGDGQMIEMEGFGYLMAPGKPMLPARSFSIALPPGSHVQSVEVEGLNARQITGRFNIAPAPPILPKVAFPQFQERIKELRDEWERTYRATYSTDAAYPEERGKFKGSGTLRKYSYASVSFYPFSYHPQSGRLVYYPAAQISIEYELPSPDTDEAQKVEEMMWDELADARASRLFVNYDQIRELYQPAGSSRGNKSQSHNYVIITSGALQSAIVASNFLDWKTSLGYDVEIVLTTDTQIAGQAGRDLAEKIRNFLRYHYIPWGIEYVLLVGDYAAVPMRYCYPDPSNHANGAGNPAAWPWAGDVPTDYYYADLSGPDAASWDSDGDGYCGEYGQDNPDFLAEVYVGRVPTNDPSRITYTLNKLVAFEQDTGAWKSSALGAGAIAYFANEDYSGRPLSDGALWIDSIETDLMTDWTTSHYSEQAGMATSEYDWPALSEAAFIGDWRNGQYGVVNWDAHGWSNRVARKVWAWDDGDGVPENQNPNEMAWYDMISTSSFLDDDHPSIVYAVSCMVGYPEPNDWGNMGIDLLTEPSYGASAGIISGTRVVWVSLGGGDLLCYEFNRYLIDGPDGPEKVGDALYDSEFFYNQNYTWEHFSEYWDPFTYNLYGDPSLVREGVRVSLCGDCNGDGIIDVADPIYLLNYLYKNGPVPDPLDNGDCNCDQTVDLGDAVYLLNYLFKGGSSPGDC